MSLDDRLRNGATALRATEIAVPSFRRAQRMHRIRRSLTATSAFLVVVIVAAGAYAASGSRRAISVTPAGPPTSETSTTGPFRTPRGDVQIEDIEHPTFAIFETPPARVLPDRKLWLAARFDGRELWLSRSDADPACGQQSTSTTSVPSNPCSEFPHHCVMSAVTPNPPNQSWCEGTGNQVIGWWHGSTQGEFANGQPVLIYGVVPDDVSRVLYDGRDVPVTNNVFVLTDPGPIDPPPTGLPLVYVVGDCQIPMYVQGQGAMYPQGDGGFTFDSRVKCGGSTPSTTGATPSS